VGTPMDDGLLQALLGEQQELPFVERFARSQSSRDSAEVSRFGFYRELIPDRKPNPGEQLAFQVSLDACTGCKACVSACHSLNGLDEHETWRDVGTIFGNDPGEPYQQHITTACHHCVDPACLIGCPVLAYEKDSVTGIVRHLDDQCIGCQYCVLKCPYDVPKYSKARGIVRKCDMCFNRLARDEAPACVQACPSSAITIQIVSVDSVVSTTAGNDQQMVPGAFRSNYTRPTTTYESQKPFPKSARPSEHLRLEHAHWPLIIMLILTQMAAGLSSVLGVLSLWEPAAFRATVGPASAAVGLLLVSGLAASVFHLGRPLGAWRAWLGLRTSWMSREIVAFAGFAGTALAWALLAWLLSWRLSSDPVVQQNLLVFATGAAAVTGLFSVVCSAMIYIDTQRPFWAWWQVLPKFLGTVIFSGQIGEALLVSVHQDLRAVSNNLLAAGLGSFLLLAVWDFSTSLYLLQVKQHPARLSSKIIWFRLPYLSFSRVMVAGLIIAFGLLLDRLPANSQPPIAMLLCALSLGWILIERYLFFVAAVAPRMPGAVAI
jgi:formate dehydrogenase iron-sulfur subunit